MFTKLDPTRRTLAYLLTLVATMVTLAFASVPLYDWFCRVTGYGGTTTQAESGAETILDKTVNVRFDGSLESGMAWQFKPVEREMDIRIGETGLAFYEAYNPTNRPIAGSASFNVFPFTVGGYFTKIDCFCFTEQVLQPGERITMPVTFFIDPEIVADADGKHVESITLSYTFYEIDLPEEQAALDISPSTDVN
ncbi:MAG: cytochrome c oxidase assembly protein [Pseudomonadota bacterium]